MKKIILLSFLILSLLSFLVYFSFGKLTIEKQILGVETNISETEKSIKKSVNFLLTQQKEFYVKESKSIFSDNTLLEALENKDRNKFYNTILEQFNRLQLIDKNFWGLHIVLPDNLSFIRVHKPYVEDKMIEKGSKPLIDKVNETKKVVMSFDDGKFGYFLRIVIPLFSKQDKYLGLAEFSINVDYLTDHIKNILTYDVQLLVRNNNNKDFLNILPKLENGLVIFKSTNKSVFEACSSMHNLNTLSHSCDSSDHKKYGNIDIILSDTGILRIAFDITNILKEQNEFMIVVNILVISIILILIIVWFILIKLFIKSKKEEILRIKNEADLHEAQKMASMGEMIGNIAHQWRQPLSIITTGATGMKIQKQVGCLSDKLFFHTCDMIDENAQYLSRTIEDFRNYTKGDILKQDFSLNTNINNFLSLVEGNIKANNINVIFKNEIDIKINSHKNELIQCYINIFNNAKDAFEEKKIKNKYFFIKVVKEEKFVRIKLSDNAGGIEEESIKKIFEPYFTTKHKYQNTGLGLLMTYNFIVKGMKGSIEAKNKTYVYNNKNYTGAEFIISLPLS